MKRFNSHFLVLSLFSIIFLTSCEDAQNRIIGVWVFDSLQRNLYENGDLTATTTEFRTDDEVMYWEFQDQDLLIYEGEQMELEQTYSWIIENDDMLTLLDEERDILEFGISSLTGKELVLKDEQYRTNGDDLTTIELIYTFSLFED